MDLSTKDRLRQAFLLAVYQSQGAGVGRDGALKRIALEEAEVLAVEAPEEEIILETVLHWKRRGLLENLTMGLGGGLSAAGVDLAENLLRSRVSGLGQRDSTGPKELLRKGTRQAGDWIYLAGECRGEGGNGLVYAAYHRDDAQQVPTQL